MTESSPSLSPSPLFSYSFLYDDCMKSKFASYPQDNSDSLILGGLTSSIKADQFSCGISNGVREGVAMSSARNVTLLRQKLIRANSGVNNNDLFSIEMWIRPRWNLSSVLTVWSIGPEKDTSSDSCGSSMMVTQNPTANITNTYFALTACANTVSSGLELSSPIIPMEKTSGLVKAIHLLITVATNSYTVSTGPRSSIKISEIAANFTINGHMGLNSSKYFVYSGSNSMSFRSWKDSDRLMIFPGTALSKTMLDPYANEEYLAVLHYFSIYGQAMSSFQRTPPLPPSPLVAYNKTEVVKQNGEVGDHYGDPSFYTKPVPVNELHTICMSLFDLDTHPSSPNYDVMKSFENSVVLRVYGRSSGRIKGKLYYFNGTPVLYDSNDMMPVTMIPWEPEPNCYALRYQPGWDEYSDPPLQVYDRLQFNYVSMNASSSVRTVDIIVKEVPKPPTTTKSSAKAVSRTHTTLTFSGSAYKSRVIDQVYISSLPYYGDLLVVDSYRSIKVIDLSMLGKGFPVKNISYFYRGPEMLFDDKKDIVGTDSFTFGVIDDYGLRSIAMEFSLNISTSIESFATDIWGSERSNTQILIKGQDHSDWHRPLHCVIIAFPQYGRLYADSQFLNQSALSASQQITAASPSLPYPLLPVFYTLGIPVLYEPIDPHYFNFPTVDRLGNSLNNANADSFRTLLTFNVSRTQKDREGVSSGATEARIQTHQIHIRNVNDPTKILYTYPSSSLGVGNVKIVKIYAFGSNTESDHSLSEFILTNLTLVDPDRGVDLVRVVVKTLEGGILQLNNTLSIGKSDKQSLFFFELPYCRRQTKPVNGTASSAAVVGDDDWYCVGDYFRPQSEFSFVSTVSTAQNVLNGAIYRSTTTNIQDKIRISIFDGVGGQCLTQSMHNNEDSIRLGCFETYLEIRIDVGEHLDSTDIVTNVSKKRSDLMSKLRYAAIGLIVLLLLLLIKWCWTRRKNRQDQNKIDKQKGGNRENSSRSKQDYRESGYGCKKQDLVSSSTITQRNLANASLDTNKYQTPPRKPKKCELDSTPVTPSTVASTPGSVRKRPSPKVLTPSQRRIATNNLYERLPTHSPEPPVSSYRSLPEGWSAHRHQSGKVFYYNSRTKKSSWKRPPETIEVKL